MWIPAIERRQAGFWPRNSVRVLALLAAMLAFLGHGSSARASRQIVHEVPRTHGGIYHLSVHEDHVSVLYFPAEVTRAVSHNHKDFTITRSGPLITIQPMPGAKGWGNLTAECELFRIGVVFKVVDDPARADTVVQFLVAEEQELVRRRVREEVQRLVGPLFERMSRHLAELKEGAARLARQRMTDDLLLRNERVMVRAMDRTDSHVVGRVPSYSWVGDDVYIDFAIENRRSGPYRLDAVEVWIHGMDRASSVAFQPTPGFGGLGVVQRDAHGRGVVCVPGASRWVGKRFTLVLHDADRPKERLSISATLRLSDP